MQPDVIAYPDKECDNDSKVSPTAYATHVKVTMPSRRLIRDHTIGKKAYRRVETRVIKIMSRR